MPLKRELTPKESREWLKVPSLDGNNVFTGTNSFTTLEATTRVNTPMVATDSDLTLLTTNIITLQSVSALSSAFDLTALTGTGRYMTIPDKSGTLAMLSDITGGSGNGVSVTVDFGSSFTQYATTTVTGQTWVSLTSKIIATPLAASGKAMETALLSFAPVVSDLVAGTGFTLSVLAPYKAKGTYTFSCVGV